MLDENKMFLFIPKTADPGSDYVSMIMNPRVDGTF